MGSRKTRKNQAGRRSKSSLTWTIGTQISSTTIVLVLWSQCPKSRIFHSHSSFCTACNDSASWWWRSSNASLIFSNLSSTSCNQERNCRPLYRERTFLSFSSYKYTQSLIKNEIKCQCVSRLKCSTIEGKFNHIMVLSHFVFQIIARFHILLTNTHDCDDYISKHKPGQLQWDCRLLHLLRSHRNWVASPDWLMPGLLDHAHEESLVQLTASVFPAK